MRKIKILEARVAELERNLLVYMNQLDVAAERLHDARRVLAAAQDRISNLTAENVYRHICTVRLRLRKQAEVARLTWALNQQRLADERKEMGE